jgi:hypothetical protein
MGHNGSVITERPWPPDTAGECEMPRRFLERGRRNGHAGLLREGVDGTVGE